MADSTARFNYNLFFIKLDNFKIFSFLKTYLLYLLLFSFYKSYRLLLSL